MTVTEGEAIWLDGELVPWNEARVHVLSHALNHGTGVFEGLRCYGTPNGAAVFRLTDHLARLGRSAHAIAMPLPEFDLEEATRAVIRESGFTDCYVRIAAFRNYGELFIDPTGSPVSVYVAAWQQAPTLAPERGLRVTISSWRRHDPNVVPPQAKVIGAYVTPAIARGDAARAGYDDAILLGANGNVAEATIANVFVARRGRVATPPLSDGPLAGITRETVIELLTEEGVTCEERSLSRMDLYTADDLFLTGTGIEIVGVEYVDGRRVAEPGSVARRVATLYESAVRGRDERWSDRLTFV